MGFLSIFKNQKDTIQNTTSEFIPEQIVREAERALGYDYVDVEQTIYMAYRVMTCYPASIEHHDSQRGGLWEHSFSVAIKAVSNIKKYTKDRKYTVPAFIAGLLHDVGKIAYYVCDTQGYDFNPLCLMPHSYPIVGKKPENDKEHALTSAMLLFSFLTEKVKNIDINLLNQLVEAILLHHSSVKPNNLILYALKDSDIEDTAEKINSIIAPSKENKGKDIDTGAETRINTWLECLRHKVLNEFQRDYNFYVVSHDGTILILLVAPVAFNLVNEIFNSRINNNMSPQLVAEMLDKHGYIAIRRNEGHFVKVTIKFLKDDGYETQRDLTVICLFADKIFTEDEIKKLVSQRVKKIKFRGQLSEQKTKTG